MILQMFVPKGRSARSAVFSLFHKCAKTWQVTANGLWRHGGGGGGEGGVTSHLQIKELITVILSGETAAKAKISGLCKNKMLAKSFDKLKTTLSEWNAADVHFAFLKVSVSFLKTSLHILGKHELSQLMVFYRATYDQMEFRRFKCMKNVYFSPKYLKMKSNFWVKESAFFFKRHPSHRHHGMFETCC